MQIHEILHSWCASKTARYRSLTRCFGKTKRDVREIVFEDEEKTRWVYIVLWVRHSPPAGSLKVSHCLYCLVAEAMNTPLATFLCSSTRTSFVAAASTNQCRHSRFRTVSGLPVHPFSGVSGEFLPGSPPVPPIRFGFVPIVTSPSPSVTRRRVRRPGSSLGVNPPASSARDGSFLICLLTC